MTGVPAGLDSPHWAVIHVNPETERTGVVDLTGVFFRWDLAVAWAARYFPDEHQSEVLPFVLLTPEFEDVAAALGEVEPTAWVLVPKTAAVGSAAPQPEKAIGPFVNLRIALADFAVHPDRYAGYLAGRAHFGMVADPDVTGELDLPPA